MPIRPHGLLPDMTATHYMVMGRKQDRWHSILAPTPALHHARTTMYTTNQSGQYDRLVLAQGITARSDTTNWQTLECALPVAATPFAQLLTQLQTQSANTNPQLTDPAFLVGTKRSMAMPLGVAGLLAAANLDSVLLVCVALCAVLDIGYMIQTTPMPAMTTQRIDRFRDWAYALLGGICLAMLLV